MWPGMWMMSCIGSVRGGFGEIWKNQLVRRVTFACSPRPCGGCCTWWGGVDGKVIIKRLCISLPYIETFNSKVTKGFVPELRSRYVFFVFRDAYVIYMYISHRYAMSISHMAFIMAMVYLGRQNVNDPQKCTVHALPYINSTVQITNRFKISVKFRVNSITLPKRYFLL